MENALDSLIGSRLSSIMNTIKAIKNKNMCLPEKFTMLIEEAQSTHNLYNDLRGCKVNNLFGNTEVQVLNSILLVSTDCTVTVLVNFYPGFHYKTEQSPKLPVWIGQTLMKV